MVYQGYDCLRIRVDRGVAFVTIDHPPINLLDLPLIAELNRIGEDVEADDDVRVVVFDSANPEFFIAHMDVNLILQIPTTVGPKPTDLNPTQIARERFRTMPKVSIAKIEGRCRGGGSEFVLALDMRYGALGRAILGQPEVAVGIVAAGGGSQRLPRLIGKGRALEVLLTANDYPADLAERYGYLDRALPAGEIGPFVEQLAYQIASFPPEGLALTKASVNAATELPLAQGLIEESYLGWQAIATPSAQRRMRVALEKGAQTREVELDFTHLYPELAEADPPGKR